MLGAKAADKATDLSKAVGGVSGKLDDVAKEIKWNKIRIDSKAFELGFDQKISPQKVPFNSHGQAAYFDGRKYITPDIDSHNITNGWKVFDRKGNRLGTFSSDLQVRIKD